MGDGGDGTGAVVGGRAGRALGAVAEGGVVSVRRAAVRDAPARGAALRRVHRRLPARAAAPPRGGAHGGRARRGREEVARGLAAGRSDRRLAAGLGRRHTTVSREGARNGGPAHDRAGAADAAAWRRAERPTAARRAARPALRDAVAANVAAKLRLRGSPEQIAAWLRRAYPDAPELRQGRIRVSHEPIDVALVVQPRGAPRRELTRSLRTGRAMRFPRGARSGGGRGQLRDTVAIRERPARERPARERPAEAEDRAVPGHWAGDLGFGRGASAVGTGRTPGRARLSTARGTSRSSPCRPAPRRRRCARRRESTRVSTRRRKVAGHGYRRRPPDKRPECPARSAPNRRRSLCDRQAHRIARHDSVTHQMHATAEVTIQKSGDAPGARRGRTAGVRRRCVHPQAVVDVRAQLRLGTDRPGCSHAK